MRIETVERERKREREKWVINNFIKEKSSRITFDLLGRTQNSRMVGAG